MIALLAALGSAVVLTFWNARRVRQALHLLQLDSYSNPRLLKWLRTDLRQRLFDLRFLKLIVPPLLLALCFPQCPCIGVVSSIWWMVAGVYGLRRYALPAEKKPLVFTSRAARIYSVAALLATLPLLGVFAVSGPHIRLILVTGLLTVELAPFAVIAANVLLIPVQRAVNYYYVHCARQKLRRFHPIVIGVTGSYGKTSTKYFLERILGEKFEVLKTPQSFNTLLGICRVINESLEAKHQIFVAEIGAYVRGDVKEKVDFIKPSVGVLTTIGPEHFERFKTMENIIATNYELIEGLAADGIAVMNDENEYTRALSDKTKHVRVARFALSDRGGRARTWAEDVSTGAHGLAFRLCESGGGSVRVTCRLLGRHNVLNIAAAATAALELGMTLEEIARGIARLECAPHRLQLSPGAGGVMIIDDSYNSNPAGAEEALQTLREFQRGKKVLVTPGMVELGVLEEESNREFGRQAADVCDYVILVGPKQTKPIQEGLASKNYPAERMRIVRTLQEATAELQTILTSGDTVLFENDLPDLYSES